MRAASSKTLWSGVARKQRRLLSQLVDGKCRASSDTTDTNTDGDAALRGELPQLRCCHPDQAADQLPDHVAMSFMMMRGRNPPAIPIRIGASAPVSAPMPVVRRMLWSGPPMNGMMTLASPGFGPPVSMVVAVGTVVAVGIPITIGGVVIDVFSH